MKLLTHNMLTSHVKGVAKGYPLLIKVNRKQLVSTAATADTTEFVHYIAWLFCNNVV